MLLWTELSCPRHTSEAHSLKTAGRVITRMFSRTLLITVLLHLLGAGHGQAGTCELLECLDCSQSLACPLCQPTPHNCNTGVPQNCTIKASNDMVVLLICVGAAAAILMLFAIIMKIALKRGQAQSQARKRQREQKLENIHSTVNTITSYY
ncbi:uncharacterized protein LOC122358227 isoform X3 [Puntigrus tetrazona]|uniref:uncharacterized protein LOC122358227 isoform X3 n=1 Tax=Puntigrus tetrazona TaxID=1606681 RepID=UPI001C8952F4|nr:uncharacterized protein LOC122358227 isoform X3 [Puntigrus tetrazona]